MIIESIKVHRCLKGVYVQVRVEGAGPILAHLDTKLSMLGSSPLQRALVRQWVSFQVGGIHMEYSVWFPSNWLIRR